MLHQQGISRHHRKRQSCCTRHEKKAQPFNRLFNQKDGKILTIHDLLLINNKDQKMVFVLVLGYPTIWKAVIYTRPTEILENTNFMEGWRYRTVNHLQRVERHQQETCSENERQPERKLTAPFHEWKRNEFNHMGNKDETVHVQKINTRWKSLYIRSIAWKRLWKDYFILKRKIQSKTTPKNIICQRMSWFARGAETAIFNSAGFIRPSPFFREGAWQVFPWKETRRTVGECSSRVWDSREREPS